MSLFKRLFGFGGAGTAAPRLESINYKGYTITPAPRAEDGQYRLAGIISREIDGELQEHHMVRADVLPSPEIAAEFMVRKAKMMIDQQGDRIFQ